MFPARDGYARTRARVPADVSGLMETVGQFQALGDRSTGSEGFYRAADLVKEKFRALGLETETQTFTLPVRVHGGSRLLLDDGREIALDPIRGNAISPQDTGPKGISGPLVYVGRGDIWDLDGLEIEGSVVLMDLDSGRNWQNLANFGARAAIYITHEGVDRYFYQDKIELTPVQFPRYVMSAARAEDLFGELSIGTVHTAATVHSSIDWRDVSVENIYCTLEGTDPDLDDEMLLVEAFYDSSALVYGKSPGADEALSIATLLEIAGHLKENPPGRSVMFLATAGHDQALAGMREAVWAMRTRTRNLRMMDRELKERVSDREKMREILEKEGFPEGFTDGELALFQDAVTDTLKTRVDTISRRLMDLRMQRGAGPDTEKVIDRLADRRFALRSILWRGSLRTLSEEERDMLRDLVPQAVGMHGRVIEDARRKRRDIRGAKAFRVAASQREVSAVVSLHLSSHGDGIGAFHNGWLYELRDRVNRTAAYAMVDEALRMAGREVEEELPALPPLYDTLRPSRLRPWDSWFPDKPMLGGEVPALAAMIGVTLATTNDARARWGTPEDTVSVMDTEYARKQARKVAGIVHGLTFAPRLHEGVFPRPGFGELQGRAKFLRHGELFPDQPAEGATIMAFQGPARYHATVDAMGEFLLKGVCFKKLTIHKVILEGYKFDPETGLAMWAIDKNQTGKGAYRVKMRRRTMETDLVMFACEQSTIYNILEPRTFRHMTKIEVFDARTDALPLRYWYSRIDTWESTLATFFMEPGARLKLTLSDNVLRKKMLLTNAGPDKPRGNGYLVDEWADIDHTEYRVARDMWALLGPRIDNLEEHGIRDRRIKDLSSRGREALSRSEQALDEKRYGAHAEEARRSWALASRVYDHVDSTQRDVLFGVLFYIALFVPFAFCMERLIFAHTNIHWRIVSFLGILLALIAVIYSVHPAFQLAYSPTVVILAFFIIGLSFLVSLIIFMRFEQEMTLLQRRASSMGAQEIGRWKAFVQAFFLGVSNLRRRKVRTGLTIATLVILTFTIMSFTTVKGVRHHARIKFSDNPAYQGYLLKNVNWLDMAPEALTWMVNALRDMGTTAPRVWLEMDEATQVVHVPVRHGERTYDARGAVGLSPREPDVTGMDEVLVGGRWLSDASGHEVLLPRTMAEELGIDPENPADATVYLWGRPFTVSGVFSGKAYEDRVDLDGEPITPVVFPTEGVARMTEAEIDAMESEEDMRSFQSRYQHVAPDQCVILPDRTLIAMGGNIKGVAVRPHDIGSLRETAARMADRYGLVLFSGEDDATYVYHAGDTLSYSGLPNIAVPIVIAVLIVLNTMIGSVFERKKEIGIYTSVGLAPSHVGFLFIAESMAFAVISVVIGYVVAQVAAGVLAGTALWSGVTVNYSSLAGVAAMVLVIVVVLVSTLYPSKVAADISIPDVNRAWTMPEPVDNVISVTLPFLMKYSEIQSVAGQLYDHYASHLDVSHGLFSVGGLDVTFVCPAQDGFFRTVHQGGVDECPGCDCDKPRCTHIRCRVWLAPFDFGMNQMVDIEFCRSSVDPDFAEIVIRLARITGEVNQWKRANKAFVHDLRKQLLVWRSLDEEGKAHFAKRLREVREGDSE